MDAVKSFNAELSSLYEVKPPISKAKMTALTRGAIKAIKFYKHVVQSVEKFILKCKAEYKVPGLYVIDSIVRQSRHQFGTEKDVFAPRFAKNLQQTFVNLFKCPPEDKSKIIRVLNLWQKNQVFAPEDIQPLFDLADPNNPIYQQIQQQSTPGQLQQQQQSIPQQTNGGSSQILKGSPALQRTPTKPSSAQLPSEAPSNLSCDPAVLQQLHQLQRLLTKGSADARSEQVHFDKKLLDFDYDDDDDEVNPSPRHIAPTPVESVASLLTNPEVLRQLQTLQSTLAGAVPSQDSEQDRLRRLQEMKLQEDEFDKHLAQTVPNLPFAAECDFKVTQSAAMMNMNYMQPDGVQMVQYESQHEMYQKNPDVEVITLDHDDSYSDDDRYKRKRSRSRSRDRGRDKDRRRRSRSRSRSRRHRTRSRDRKDKNKEKESEKDKERKKRGLPAMKSNNLSVCSTTLWVGHLSKLVHQDDLSNTFGEFGDIVSIDLIIPRGCAFIVMHRRQDAARCLAKLKNYNLHGKAITLAWAPGKGVKGKDLKDYWEGELGVSYIPWHKLRETMDLEALEDGGMIDEDTMPDWMKKKVEDIARKKAPLEQAFMIANTTVDTSQPPPMPPTSLMQTPMLSMVNFPMNNRFLGMIPNLSNISLGVPPPSIAPPSMMTNLGLPFQGPPGFMPSTLPPETKQLNQTDVKLRNIGESLMSLAGQPLTMPPHLPMTQPPPPIHLDDNMDIEMEDVEKPSNERFSPRRRDRSNDRGRRRSRSRENRGRDRSGDRDRIRNRDRDFGRRDRDRRGNDRDRGRWGNDRNNYDRRDRNGRNDFERRERRDSEHSRDKGDREKSLNERLKEMAGIKFDDQNEQPTTNEASDVGTEPNEATNQNEASTGDADSNYNFQFEAPRPYDDEDQSSFDAGGEFPSHFGPDGPPPPSFRGGGATQFVDEEFPHEMMMEGGFGPPDRFFRGGRRGGRGRGRGRGPDFYPREDFMPPPMLDWDDGPIRDDFGPPMRSEFGPPMNQEFRGGMRGGRGSRGGFFNRGGFRPEFDGPPPPEFFRGGPRGRPFGDFARGRGRGFRGGTRSRSEFFDGPPGTHFEQQADDDQSGDRKKGRLSRWGGEDEHVKETENNGGATPLRDEIQENLAAAQAMAAPSAESYSEPPAAIVENVPLEVTPPEAVAPPAPEPVNDNDMEPPVADE